MYVRGLIAAFEGQESVKRNWNDREEKSLRHVAMVAKFLDDNKRKINLKSKFALFQTSSILFNFVYFVKFWQNIVDLIRIHLSLEKEK